MLTVVQMTFLSYGYCRLTLRSSQGFKQGDAEYNGAKQKGVEKQKNSNAFNCSSQEDGIFSGRTKQRPRPILART